MRVNSDDRKLIAVFVGQAALDERQKLLASDGERMPVQEEWENLQVAGNESGIAEFVSGRLRPTVQEGQLEAHADLVDRMTELQSRLLYVTPFGEDFVRTYGDPMWWQKIRDRFFDQYADTASKGAHIEEVREEGGARRVRLRLTFLYSEFNRTVEFTVR